MGCMRIFKFPFLSHFWLAGLVVVFWMLAPMHVSGDTSRQKSWLGIPGTRKGVVSSVDPTVSRIGEKILREGGNAIDAAAAMQFALNVAEPHCSGLGGGAFILVHLAHSRQTIIVDAREKAPARADPEMFLLASDPSKAFHFAIRSTSGVAVGVPGTLLGVHVMLENWGTMSLAQVLAPGIDLAEKGVVVGDWLAKSILSSRLDSEPGNPAYELARSVFRPNAIPLQTGDLLIQPDLGKTFRRIAEQGISVFYSGEIARKIVDTQKNARTVAHLGDQAKLTGRMIMDDLIDYNVVIRQPVEFSYRGYRFLSTPPPSSGGLSLAQILGLIERFPIGGEKAGFGFGAPRTINVMLEAMRLTFADRAVWMGDDDHVAVPSEGLLSEAYLASRSALINPDDRQADVQAGDPRTNGDDFVIGETVNLDDEGVNTTHFTVVDKYGNIVGFTSTIESLWGTGLMVPGFGFLLNNELTDFNRIPTFNPDPEQFNPGANDAAPYKRPRSSIAPTMIFRGKKPVIAMGSPGGSNIINILVNLACNLIDHHLNIQEAVDAPRISQTSGNGSARREVGFPSSSVLEDLESLGHAFGDPADLGAVQAIAIDRCRRQYAAADKRRGGSVISVRSECIRQECQARNR